LVLAKVKVFWKGGLGDFCLCGPHPFFQKRFSPKSFFCRLGFYMCLALLFTSPASAIVGNSSEAFGLDGSLRTIGTWTSNYDFEPFFGKKNKNDNFSQTILRLTASGKPNDYIAYEMHAVQSLDISTQQSSSTGTAGFGLVPRKTRYRTLNETQNWIDEDNRLASLWLDRLNIRFSNDWMDLTLGRQAITFGKAYFWNPLDVFLPFDPRQFDRDYKAGVDALRLDINLGNFSGLNVIGTLGHEIDITGEYVNDKNIASWYGSALLIRYFTNLENWDISIQGGKVYGGYQLGGGVVGELNSLEIRLELAYLFTDKTRALPHPYKGDLVEDHLTAVIGTGKRFENSLTIEGEYIYNGSGDPKNLDSALVRYSNGTRFHLGRNLVGIMASYDFLPILSGKLAGIYSFSDLSCQVLPLLTYSVSDESDLLLGALLNFGRRPVGNSAIIPKLQSEFGTYPNVYYIEVKVYF